MSDVSVDCPGNDFDAFAAAIFDRFIIDERKMRAVNVRLKT